MREQERGYGISDRERRRRRRELRMRQERRRKIYVSAFAAIAAACVVLAGSFLYSSIRTNAGSGFKYYACVTVEAGDTLWDMADEYIDYEHYRDKNQYVDEVRHINGLNESCSVTAGQVIVIPYYSDEYRE